MIFFSAVGAAGAGRPGCCAATMVPAIPTASATGSHDNRGDRFIRPPRAGISLAAATHVAYSARHRRRESTRHDVPSQGSRTESEIVPPARPVIVTCAVTGAIHTPSMSPHLPITPAQIAAEAIAAARAGAAIVHLHARDPVDGR